MKLYGVSDGPPSLAVRMTLAALEVPFELKPVDYIAAEHMTDEYAKVILYTLLYYLFFVSNYLNNLEIIFFRVLIEIVFISR